MSEIINVNNVRDYSWFSHLLFGSDYGKVRILCDSPDYDPSNMNVELRVNGVELRMEDFNQLLDKWSDSIEEQLKEKYGLNKFDEAVLAKAEQLIKDRLGNIQEVLQNVEDNLWKLEINEGNQHYQ